MILYCQQLQGCLFLLNQHRFHNPGQFPFFSAHRGPQSLQQSPAIVLVRQEVVDEVVDEGVDEVEEVVDEVVVDEVVD